MKKTRINKSNMFSLYEEFSKLSDVRRAQGKRHPLELVIMIVILSIMSGWDGYRAVGDFIEKNKKELIELLKPKKNRLPSFSTIRRVMKSVNFDELCVLFERWAKIHIRIKEKEWISIDGKAIRGTLSDDEKRFVNLVSLFCVEKKQVFSMGKVDDKSNEIPKVQELIEKFPVKKVIYRMDAMHCQKKTVKKILKKDSFYVLQVKENQEKLLKKIKFICKYFPIISSNITKEKNRGRLEKREVCVYKEGLDLKHEWSDIKQVIKVRRTVKNKDEKSEETAFFITNLSEKASFFNKGIRGHWRIENSLHYIKDVVLNEDRSRIRTGSAPQNMSLLRTLVINIFRLKGYSRIKQATRLISGNVKLMLSLLL
jgi:predicted transposase YbfD/YdcC